MVARTKQGGGGGGRVRGGEQKGKRNESRRGHGGKWNEKKGDDGLTDRRRLRAERAFPWALFAVHPFTGCSATLFSQVYAPGFSPENGRKNIAN